MTPAQVYALAAPWLQGQRRREGPRDVVDRIVERAEQAPPGDLGGLASLASLPFGGRRR